MFFTRLLTDGWGPNLLRLAQIGLSLHLDPTGTKTFAVTVLQTLVEVGKKTARSHESSYAQRNSAVFQAASSCAFYNQ